MKKMIAPIIVTIIVLGFILFYLSAIVLATSKVHGFSNNAFLILLIVLLIAAMLTMIYVLIQRIKEIKEEEKDDLSKY